MTGSTNRSRSWFILIALLAGTLPVLSAQPHPASRVDRIDRLIGSYLAAEDNEKRQIEIVSRLFMLGEKAIVRVERLEEETRTRVEAYLKKTAGKPGELLKEERKRRKAEWRRARNLRKAIYMEIVINAFRENDEKKMSEYVYPGQYGHLKKSGKRAVEGALMLMQGENHHSYNCYRNRAWQVVADVCDRTHIKELKKILGTATVDGEIRLGAACALGALGDCSAVEPLVVSWVSKFQKSDKNDPDRDAYITRIFELYHRSRQYEKAIFYCRKYIEQIEIMLANPPDKKPDKKPNKKAVKGLRDTLARWSYNCACCYVLDRNIARGYAMLAKSLKYDREAEKTLALLKKDGELKNLFSDQGFERWFKAAKQGKYHDQPPPIPDRRDSE